MSYKTVKGDTLWGIYKRNKAKGNTSSWNDYTKANQEYAKGKMMNAGESITVPNNTIPEVPTVLEKKLTIDIPKADVPEGIEAIQNKEALNINEEDARTLPLSKAQEAQEKTADEPQKHSDANSCCCMVAPWTVNEEGREYLLKVTKVGKAPIPGSDKEMDISVKEVPSNKEEKKFELHIVATPADEKGNKTYRKIVSMHKFLRNKGNLLMVLKNTDKSIKEGGSFKIDTDGFVVTPGATKNKTENFSYFPNACIGVKDPNAALAKLQENIRYNSMSMKDLLSGKTLPKESIEQYKYFEECRKVVNELKQKALLEQREVFYGNRSALSKGEKESAFNLQEILALLFKPSAPNKIVLTPTGCTKGSSPCASQPTVDIHLYPYFKLAGAVSFSVGEHYEKKKIQNKRTEVSGGSTKGSLALEITKGTSSYAFTHDIVKAKADNKIKTKDIKDSAIIFGPLAKMVTKIYKASAASNKMSKHKKGRGKNTFDPGMTKFEFSAEDLMLAEDSKSHDVYWKGKAILSLTFFDGANMTIDLIPYVLGLAGPVGKLLEKAISVSAKALADTGANKHMHADIKLDFKISGHAKGALVLDFIDKETLTSTGLVEGKVGLEIIGLVEAGLDAFGVEAGAGAGFKSGSAKSSKDSTDITCRLSIEQSKQGAMPKFKGDITTDGLAIYYAWYGYTRRKQKDETLRKKKGSWENNSTLTFKDEEKIELIGPFSFIDEIKKIIG